MNPKLPLLVCFLTSLPLCAAEFQGASAVIDRMAAQIGKPPQKETSAKQLRDKIENFQKEASKLAPEVAASRWLALYNAISTLQPNDNSVREIFGNHPFPFLLASLPPTAAWGALVKEIEAQPKTGSNIGLRFLASVLQGDAASRARIMDSLEKEVLSNASVESKIYLQSEVHQAIARVQQFDTLPADRLAAFERELSLREKPETAKDFEGPLLVPELVKAAGETKARALLMRAMAVAENGFEVSDEATREVAAVVALEQVEKLKRPTWKLVATIKDASLYEALAKRFAEPSPSYEEMLAKSVYFMALVAKDRTKEAVDLIVSSSADDAFFGAELNFRGYQEKGFDTKMLVVLREALRKNPTLRCWDSLIEFSAHAGDSAGALAFLREMEKKPDFANSARVEIRDQLVSALLAAGEVDEAVRLLREAIATMAADAEKGPKGSIRSRDSELADKAMRLARLGRLLKKPEWSEEAIRVLKTRLSGEDGFKQIYATRAFTDLLLESGRAAEAESLIAGQLEVAMQARKFEGARGVLEPLAQLVGIYHQAGRHVDVLTLLERSPFWGAGDLEELSQEMSFASNTISIPVAAAQALASAGRKEEAKRVVERWLQERPGDDPGYALRLSLDTSDFGELMDRLASLDRFQERPLIWKAQWLFNAGKLAEAEKTVRAAIAIDPSDGEEGKGDRMRAYAVLADILEKTGDAEQAGIMRGAVAAIRLSEDADDWWQAGLLSQAVKMYEEALGHFADAYCIQSRLALRYSEIGDHARAAQYYQRAFELMPESFGRIESHCFGCEGAFKGERAQGIADQVFTKLAQKTPDRPQVFYLLGYLRESQDRKDDAAAMYLKAVTLDTDYFNAWQKLAALSAETNSGGKDADDAALAMLRLDPQGRHNNSAQQVHDIRRLWDAILAAEKIRPVLATGPYFTLPSSKAELEKTAEDPNLMHSIFSSRVRGRGPRQLWAEHPLMLAVGHWSSLAERLSN